MELSLLYDRVMTENERFLGGLRSDLAALSHNADNQTLRAFALRVESYVELSGNEYRRWNAKRLQIEADFAKAIGAAEFPAAARTLIEHVARTICDSEAEARNLHKGLQELQTAVAVALGKETS